MASFRSFLHSWKAACRPFVHRTFRGRLWQRALFGSAVWAVLTVCTSLWIALGSGAFERELRVGLGFEEPYWQRQQLDFVHLVETDIEENLALDARRTILDHGNFGIPPTDDSELSYRVHTLLAMRDEARGFLRAALLVPAPEAHHELAAQGSRLLEWNRPLPNEAQPYGYPSYEYSPSFDWTSEMDVRRLRAIVDADLVPNVERYASPLDRREIIAIVGIFSGGFFLLASLVLAPLFAGVQVAQEVHENTLQPLAGTALTERQLALGLSSAPVARAGILAAPHLVLVLLCASVAAKGWTLLLGMAMAFAVGGCLTMLAQLAGLAMGRRRAPGIVAMTLLSLLGMTLLVALVYGVNLRNEDALGMLALFPQGGPIAALLAAFSPNHATHELDSTLFRSHLASVALAFAAFLVFATLAFERRLATRTQASLTAIEHALAATVVTLLGLTVLPDTHEFTRGSDCLALATVYPAMLLLLVARVPVGERVGTEVELPWRALAGAYFVGLAVHTVALVLTVGELPYASHPGPALAHLAWFLLMGFLLAVGAVARPMTVGRSIRALLTAVMLVLEFITAMYAVSESSAASYLPTLEVSALLGLVHLGMLIVLPLAYLRDLGGPRRRRNPNA